MTSTAIATSQSETTEFELAQRMVDLTARNAARSIMMYIIEFRPDMDEVARLVNLSCQEYAVYLLTGDPSVITDEQHQACVARYRDTLVAEGRRISPLLVWDGGTA